MRCVIAPTWEGLARRWKFGPKISRPASRHAAGSPSRDRGARENMLAYHGRGYSASGSGCQARDDPRYALPHHCGCRRTFECQPWTTNQRHASVAGPYTIHTMDVECLSVVTNKPPTGPTGGWRPGALFLWSAPSTSWPELALDPAEIRRRNLSAKPFRMPQRRA